MTPQTPANGPVRHAEGGEAQSRTGDLGGAQKAVQGRVRWWCPTHEEATNWRGTGCAGCRADRDAREWARRRATRERRLAVEAGDVR